MSKLNDLNAIRTMKTATMFGRRGEINRYLAGLKPHDGPSPALEPELKKELEKTRGSKDEKGRTLKCTTSTYTLTTQPDEVVLYSPDVEVLWLGALVQGTALKGIGSFKELPIRKRAPVEVALTVRTIGNTAIVQRPNSATLQKAMGDFSTALKNAAYDTSISFKFSEAETFNQAMLDLGLSAHYSGATFRARHEKGTTDKKSIISCSYIEKCFTAFTPLPSLPSDLFTSDFSMDDLRDQVQMNHIGPENVPVLLSAIAYGRMFYCTISSNHKMSELKTTLYASFEGASAGGSASLTDFQKQILRESTITVSAIGVPGGEASVEKIIRAGNLQEFFSQRMGIETASPISFIFRNIADLSIASFKNSGEIVLTVCVPEVVSEEVMTRTAAVDQAYDWFWKLVEAAASNVNDLPTREERTRGFRTQYSLADFHFDWLEANLGSIKSDDKLYCKDWLKGLTDKMAERRVIFQSEHDNRPWNRPIYAEGLKKLSELQQSGDKVRALL